MIGALIGDIAAWTYEHEQDTFWKQLIPDGGRGAEPSVYGHALMRAASKNVLDVPGQDVNFIHTSSEWSSKERLRFSGQWLMWQLMCAWDDDKIASFGMPSGPSMEKEDGYARMFVINLIRSLRAGNTKSKAYHSEQCFKDLSKHWNWRPWLKTDGGGDEYSTLTHVFRAWDSFYRGFDFTSSLHNAMKWDGDRHLIATLTGAFADAMYGCGQSMIKQKFGNSDCVHGINLLCFPETFGYHHAIAHEMMEISATHRVFWAKNYSRTNVEWHHWAPVHSDYEHKIITKELRRRIIKSFEPGWEDRYSFYLDDGWIYLCRSFVLIGRFKFNKKCNGTYRICSLELCDNVSALELHRTLEGAMYSVEHHWEQLWGYDNVIHIDDSVASY